MSESTKPPQRRSFLTLLTWLAGIAAAFAFVIPFVLYLFGALKKRGESSWNKPVTLGPVSEFPLNETRLVTFVNPLKQPWDGMAANTSCFVRNLGEGKLQVLAANCTHLGCPVSWFPQSGLFMCPCHGGVYYEDGKRASGPPPEDLYPCVWRIENGQLQIQAPHLPTLQDPLKKHDSAKA